MAWAIPLDRLRPFAISIEPPPKVALIGFTVFHFGLASDHLPFCSYCYLVYSGPYWLCVWTVFRSRSIVPQLGPLILQLLHFYLIISYYRVAPYCSHGI